MITVATYLAQRLNKDGPPHAFPISGGAMSLNDELSHQVGLAPNFFHHEQADAMAARAGARIASMPPIVNLETGPGGINAISGVFGAWTDSIPTIIISGQLKRATRLATMRVAGPRQLGDQRLRTARRPEIITGRGVGAAPTLLGQNP